MAKKRLIIKKLKSGETEVLVQERVEWLFFTWWKFYNSNIFSTIENVYTWVHYVITELNLRESDVIDETITDFEEE